MHELNHTPCIMNQTIEPSIACFSTNIVFETNYRLDVLQNVPTFHGHVVQGFHALLDFVSHLYTHLAILWRRCCPSQWYILICWRTRSFSLDVKPTPNSPIVCRLTFEHSPKISTSPMSLGSTFEVPKVLEESTWAWHDTFQ